MRVYLVRDVLREGVIRIGEGTPLTGKPDTIQVNGRSLGDRIFKRGQWCRTWSEARIVVLRRIEQERENIARQLRRFEELEATCKVLELKYRKPNPEDEVDVEAESERSG